jgi:hypothetical protein
MVLRYDQCDDEEAKQRREGVGCREQNGFQGSEAV